jgi:uncharacterized repeat protein (TIGR01451 family)
VTVSNAAGSVVSRAATLTVTAATTAPTITAQPSSASVTAPAQASFAVSATGTPAPGYQWQLSVDGGVSFADITGATAASYTTPATLPADNGKKYRAVVSNSAGSATSSVATLTVATPPSVQTAIVAKSSSAQPGGQPVTFIVTETNAAAAYTGAHTVYATVPAYTTVAQAAASGASCTGTWPCQPGQQIRWTYGVGAGQSESTQFSAVVTASGAPASGTILTSNVTSTAAGASSSSATVTVKSAPGLQLSLIGQPNVAVAGGTLTYTLTCSNAGSSAVAANLAMPLPAGVSFVSASNGGSIASGTVQWALGTVPAGSSATRQLVVQVANPTAASLVTASASLVDPTSSQTLASANDATVLVANPMQPSVTAATSPVQPGQPVTFIVTETNTASAYSGAHTVYATVPAFTTVTFGGASGASCTGGSWPCQPGQQVYWTYGVNAAQSESTQFSAIVSSTAPPPNGTQLASTATSTLSGAGTATANLVANDATSLQLFMTGQPNVATAGGVLSYVLTYSNAGSSAVAATLVMPLPAGTSFVSASEGSSVASGIVQWDLGSVSAGSSGIRQLVVQVANPSVASFVAASAALVAPTSSQTLASASDAAVLVANPVQLSATVASGPVQPGQPVTFTVTEANAGASYTGAHTVYASVPANTTVAQGAASGGSCTGGTWPCQPGQQVYWTFGVNAGQSQSAQFSPTVSSASNGTQLVTVVTRTLSGGGIAKALAVVNP